MKLIILFAVVAVAFAAEKTDLKTSSAYGLGYADRLGMYNPSPMFHSRFGMDRMAMDPMFPGMHGIMPHQMGIPEYMPYSMNLHPMPYSMNSHPMPYSMNSHPMPYGHPMAPIY